MYWPLYTVKYYQWQNASYFSNSFFLFYQVVKGGAADRAGLEDEDIVVEVNGVNVEMSTHEEVVNLIRQSGDRLVLLVAEKTAYDHLKAKGIAITPQLLDEEPSADIPAPACAQEEVRNEQHQVNESDKETERPASPPRSRVSTVSGICYEQEASSVLMFLFSF